MTHARLRAASLTVSLVAVACQCQQPPLDDTTGTETELSSSGSMSSGSAVSGTTADEDDDLINQRFLAGVFHGEHIFTPFGGEGPEVGGARLTNVEFRPDGTATMWMETCSLSSGTNVIQWEWSPAPGPWIEITPGEGEQSLRFFAAEGVQSLRATIDDECIMHFEYEGELHTSDTFKLGRACWVKRCEFDRVHVDYCEGEQIPACP